jgi:hypothetical protein
VLDSLVTVGGALLGVLAGGFTQARLSHRDTRRQQALNAIAALVAALDAHRAAMWRREEIRLTAGSPEDVAQEYEAARAASHVTRGALTMPLVTIRLLMPDLATRADAAAKSTYALRDATTMEGLQIQRGNSMAAREFLLAAVGRNFSI